MTDDQLRAAFGQQPSLPNTSPSDREFFDRLEGKLNATWDSDTTNNPSTWAEATSTDHLDSARRDAPNDGLSVIDVGELTVNATPIASRRRARFTASVALIAAAALVGGVVYVRRDETRKPLTLAAITAATEQAGSARVAVALNYDVKAVNTGGGDIKMTTEGTIDFEANAGDTTTRVDGDVFATAQSAPNRGEPSTTVSKARWRDKDVWRLSTGSLAQFAGRSNGKWIHTRRDYTVVNSVPFLLIRGGSGESIDPTKMLRALQSVATLTKIGTEDLRGDATTKYRVTTTRKAIDPSSRSTKEVSLEIWADGDARLRKIAAGAELMRPVGAELSMEFYDYGVKVDVQPPAKADTIEQDDLDFNPDEPLKLTGDWAKLGNGSEGGINWELWKAPASQSQICYSLHTDPKIENAAKSPFANRSISAGPAETSAVDGDGTPVPAPADTAAVESPTHEGDSSFCVFSFGALDTSHIAFDGFDTSRRVLAIAGVTKGNAVITYSDNSTETVEVENNHFVLVRPLTPAITKLVIGNGDEATVCRPEATEGGQAAMRAFMRLFGSSCMTAALDDQQQGPGELTGKWAAVRSGNNAGVKWQLMQAPARKDWFCWALATEPSINRVETYELLTPDLPDTNHEVQYEGNDAICAKRPDVNDGTIPSFVSRLGIGKLVESTGQASTAALALWLADGIDSGTITLKDGSTINADIDTTTHTLVYVGSQPIDSMTLTGSAGEFVCYRPTRGVETDENGKPIAPVVDPKADYEQSLECGPEEFSNF